MTESISAEEYNRRKEKGSKNPHKYGAQPIVVDGITFDSTAEGTRYWELKQLERTGLIVNLELQPAFPLTAHGVHLATYISDFRYVDVETNEIVVEDVKGVRTSMYRLKRKWVKAQYGIEIREVMA